MSTPLTLYRPGVACGRDAQALHRAATPDFSGWLEHTRAAAGCTRPIRLSGTISAVEPSTGRVLIEQHTDELPDRALYKACGNRRDIACPACAWVYQRDAYQVVRSGLIGGKGVPATGRPAPGRLRHLHRTILRRRPPPARHPSHLRQPAALRLPARTLPRPPRPPAPASTGSPRRASPATTPTTRSSGSRCAWTATTTTTRSSGTYFSGELWRRTKQAIERHLAALCPPTRHPPRPGRHRLRQDPPGAARAGVARQGRRDAAPGRRALPCPAPPRRRRPRRPGTPSSRHRPASPSTTWTTPSARRRRRSPFTTPPHPDRPDGWPIAWGEQVDVRRISTGRRRGHRRQGRRLPRQVRHQGHRGHRPLLHPAHRRHHRRLRRPGRRPHRPPHRRLLAPRPPHPTPTPPAAPQRPTTVKPALTPNRNVYAGLRRWAHMLGFGGHFLTKARRYSVTFGLLRDTRATYRRTEARRRPTDADHRRHPHLHRRPAGSPTATPCSPTPPPASDERARRIGREELAHETWLSGAAA